MRTLICLAYSPWSEKARWALDHHLVRYRREDYLPLIGEPWLRVRARRWRGRIGVPVLLDHGRVFADSFDIARRAEDLRGGAPLFPPEAGPAIDSWNARSEAALAAGRALLLERMVGDAEALDESLPAALPSSTHGMMRPVARSVVRYLASKYRAAGQDADAHHRTLTTTLEDLRSALSGRPTILPSGFTYADIAMSVVLQLVEPVDDRFMRLRPATRRAWRDPELAALFSDLVAWRDELYAIHREVRSQ